MEETREEHITHNFPKRKKVSFNNNNCIFFTKCPSYRGRESEIKVKSRLGCYTGGYTSFGGRSLVFYSLRR